MCFHSKLICVIFFVLNLLQYLHSKSCPTQLCHSEWSPDQIPNPQTESGQCGRFCKNTWICDPCKTMDNITLDEIDKEIGPRKICGSNEEYTIVIVIINKMKVRPENRGMDGMVFSKFIRDKMEANLGKNGNEVVIFLSKSEKQVFTSVGDKASEILTSKCQQHTNDKAFTYFYQGQFGAGLMSMTKQYNNAFKVGVCDVPPDGYFIIFLSALGLVIVVPLIILCTRAIIHDRRQGKHFCTDCTRDIEGLVLDHELIIKTEDKDEKKSDDVDNKDLEKNNIMEDNELDSMNVEKADNMEYKETYESDSENEDNSILIKLPYNRWMRLR